MPNLHETMMGRKFFEGTLPQLVKSIERLAKAVEENNELLTKKEEAVKEEK